MAHDWQLIYSNIWKCLNCNSWCRLSDPNQKPNPHWVERDNELVDVRTYHDVMVNYIHAS
jgi:hypothetical protein